MPDRSTESNKNQERGSGARTPAGGRNPLNEGARAPKTRSQQQPKR